MSGAAGLVESVPDAVRALRAGDRRVLSRMLSALEDGGDVSARVMSEVRDTVAPDVPVLALTGAPGVGKSTLLAALAGAAAADGQRVAVLAVDPSSPITGGAVLGDRVRMAPQLSESVFIRSFANRGLGGGLARVIPDAVELVSIAGYTIVFIETVGVGQSEIDVSRFADVTAVVLAPQMGDEVQAAKAGLMEIADVFVVNKCDLPGASRTVNAVRASTRMQHAREREVSVLRAAAATGEHVADVWRTLQDLLSEAVARRLPGEARAARARLDELAALTAEVVRSAWLDGSVAASSVVGRVVDGQLAVRDAAPEIEQLLTRGAA